MKVFKVEITETLQKTVEVKALDEADAIIKVKEMYRKEKIVLNETSYIDTDFAIIKEKDPNSN